MNAPVLLARCLEAFFTQRLMRERSASPHTVAAYRDCFRLLLSFAHRRLARAPAATRPAPAMHAWPRSTPSSATSHCKNPHMLPASSASWRCRASATRAGRWTS
jgi:hypothetical protein